MAIDTPVAAVQQYIDAFNSADIERMAAPHLWQGASGYFVDLGEAVHDTVSGDSAYVVVPATMTFDLNGTQVTQRGSFLTVALRRLAEGWRIAAWAWTKGTQ